MQGIRSSPQGHWTGHCQPRQSTYIGEKMPGTVSMLPILPMDGASSSDRGTSRAWLLTLTNLHGSHQFLPVQPSMLRAHLSQHCSSPRFHVPTRQGANLLPLGTRKQSHVGQPVSISDFWLFFGAAGSNMFSNMLELPAVLPSASGKSEGI